MNNPQLRKWLLVALGLLLLYVFETSLLPWLLPEGWRTPQLSVFPKLTLVGILYVGIFSNRHIGTAYGLSFGLLQDVMFYGHMLGVNAFTYGLSGYLAGFLIRPMRIGIVPVFLIQLSGLMLHELASYALYRLFSVTDMEFSYTFINGMMPSILIGLFLALLLYIPVRKWLEPPPANRDADEESRGGRNLA